MMTTSHLKFYSASFLTPKTEEEFSESDVSVGLNRLRNFLLGCIVPDRTFVMFESAITKDERKFDHVRNLLGMMDEKSDIPEFDIIQFRGIRSYDLDNNLRNNLLAQSMTVQLPEYGLSDFDLSFQFSAFSVRLLRRIVDTMLRTETLPYVTSTQIIPLAYKYSRGLVQYWIDYDEEDLIGFDMPDTIKDDIREFHRPLLGNQSDCLVKEYTSCVLL